MQTSDQAKFEESIKAIEHLHGNVAVLSQLMKILRDPNSELEAISRLLKTDSAITANVIRISNSAAYGAGAGSDSIEEALQKVGMNETMRLVGAAISKNVFQGDLKAYGVSADQYWIYSYFCACFLEQTAHIAREDTDQAYLLGLLHAVGRIVIDMVLNNGENEVFWDPSIEVTLWEFSLTGFSQAEAGAELLRKWGFGSRLCLNVENQYFPAWNLSHPISSLLSISQDIADHNHWNLNQESWELPENVKPNASLSLSMEELEEHANRALITVKKMHSLITTS